MPLILIIIGIVLIIYSYRSVKKENEMKREEDGVNISFQSVLQDSKEELNDYKMEIGILRRDIAESLTELQEEILDIRNNLNKLKNNKEIDKNEHFLNENYIDNKINNKVNDQKIKEINQVDEITDEIGESLFVDLDIDDGIISEIDFSEKAGSSKTQNIKKLLKKGLTEDQICHELSVSKGEVLLVKGLFRE